MAKAEAPRTSLAIITSSFPKADDRQPTFLQAQATFARQHRPVNYRRPHQAKSQSSPAAMPIDSNWVLQHRDVLQWVFNEPHNNFAVSLAKQYQEKGKLSPGQVDAVREILGDPDARARRQAAKVAAAPSVAGAGFEKLLTAFKAARATGLRAPVLRCGEFSFSYAIEGSSNPGFVYIKLDGSYKGKVSPEGRFIAATGSAKYQTTAPTQEEISKIIQVGRDPHAAAIQHGRLTGRCAICNRPLDNAQSVQRGIGPICAEKFGW